MNLRFDGQQNSPAMAAQIRRSTAHARVSGSRDTVQAGAALANTPAVDLGPTAARQATRKGGWAGSSVEPAAAAAAAAAAPEMYENTAPRPASWAGAGAGAPPVVVDEGTYIATDVSVTSSEGIYIAVDDAFAMGSSSKKASAGVVQKSSQDRKKEAKKTKRLPNRNLRPAGITASTARPRSRTAATGASNLTTANVEGAQQRPRTTRSHSAGSSMKSMQSNDSGIVGGGGGGGGAAVVKPSGSAAERRSRKSYVNDVAIQHMAGRKPGRRAYVNGDIMEAHQMTVQSSSGNADASNA